MKWKLTITNESDRTLSGDLPAEPGGEISSIMCSDEKEIRQWMRTIKAGKTSYDRGMKLFCDDLLLENHLISVNSGDHHVE